MATNAGEVRITLAANAAEFKKVLQDGLRLMRQLRLEAAQLNSVLSRQVRSPINTQSTQAATRSFANAGQAATQFGRASENAGRRTSRSINQANTSVTLLVAKFALLTFAIQTVANILDKTFGAALRSVDDFEQGVIGTAAAITNLANLTGGTTFGQAFAQNLEFVRGAFQELEIIAGDFFSTATDLQLAFNTLAARGVVIRREEFNTLGLITDQIKLQTRGQVSSIQIAQELRNLFTGQVRAADQLAQLIKAQGGNVKEISDELRRTGSLAALEPFVAGLREAQGLFRGLLSPAIARFTAQVERINRFVIADVFRGTVSILNTINDLLDQNIGDIVLIGNLVVNRIVRGFREVLSSVASFGRIIVDIATNAVPLLAIGVRTIFRSFGLLPQILIFVSALIIQQAAGFGGILQVVRLIGNVLRTTVLVSLIAIDAALESIKNFGVNLERIFAGLGDLFRVGFLTNLRRILALAEKLPGVFGRTARSIRETVDQQIVDISKEQIDIQAKIKTGSDDESGTLIERLMTINEELENFNVLLGGTEQQTDAFLSVAEAIGATQEELGRAIVAAAKATAISDAAPFDTRIVEPDSEESTASLRRLIDAQRRLREEAARLALAIELKGIQDRGNALDLQVAQELLTERDAQSQRIDLLRQETQARLVEIQKRRELEVDANQQQLARIESDKSITDELVRQNQLNTQNTISSANLLRLDGERLEVEQQLTSELAKQAVEAEKVRRETDRLLESRQRDVDTSFVSTLSDRLAELDARNQEERRQLESQPGVTDQQLAQQDQIASDRRFFESVRAPLTAALSAIDQAFNSLVQGIVQGSLDFRQVAQNIGTTLIQGGLQELVAGLKKSLVDGLKNLFDGLGDTAAAQAGAALAVGIGLLLAVLSRVGNDASFTPGGGTGGGSIVESSQAVRGIIGGDTSIAIAQINNGLQEALIPTNNILASIERNTRSLAELNLNINPDQLAQGIQDQIGDILSQALLQVTP